MAITYLDLIEKIQRGGEWVAPRGEPTREVLDASICIPIGKLVGRNRYNMAIGIIEGLGVVAGRSVEYELRRIAPKTMEKRYFGPSTNYGERLNGMLDLMVEELRADASSRRAAIYLGHNADLPDHRPCTQSVQFMIRKNRFHCFVNMRSWDAILGLPNDIAIWTVVGQAMAAMLGTQVGWLHFRAASLHIYLKHLEWVDCLAEPQAHTILPLGTPLGASFRNYGEACLSGIDGQAEYPYDTTDMWNLLHNVTPADPAILLGTIGGA